MTRKSIIIIITCVFAALCLAGGYFVLRSTDDGKVTSAGDAPSNGMLLDPSKPYAAKALYRKGDRSIDKLVATYEKSNDATSVALAKKIADQPSALWLTGPSDGDASAQRDMALVARTSAEAGTQNSLPVYVLYAIPLRDACAAYSKGGFADSTSYTKWIDAIIAALKTPALFIVEPDATGHAVEQKCLSAQQATDRKQLLASAIERLKASNNSAGVYLDAANAEWFVDPTRLVEALKASGVAKADGIAVNVSNFVATDESSRWAKQLVDLLGGTAGVVIDTSRNGQGAAPPATNPEMRWCNPSGRGIGARPTTSPNEAHVHAYLWIKGIGESDGACRGNPAAGTFSAALALELARNDVQSN